MQPRDFTMCSPRATVAESALATIVWAGTSYCLRKRNSEIVYTAATIKMIRPTKPPRMRAVQRSTVRLVVDGIQAIHLAPGHGGRRAAHGEVSHRAPDGVGDVSDTSDLPRALDDEARLRLANEFV